jgi:hypothetical protein
MDGLLKDLTDLAFGFRKILLTEIFYRTENEDKEYQDDMLYGKDIKEWLKRWDEGRSVWSIEMGGLGPGYEQCIQITCAEIVRFMISKNYDTSKWNDENEWKKIRNSVEKMSSENEIIEKLGLSGAQWGGALNLAIHLYRDGPKEVMKDKKVENRKIQVQRTFPVA